MKLCEQSIVELHALRLKGEITTVDIAQSVAKRIEAVDKIYNAYISKTIEAMLVQAQKIDEQISAKTIVHPLAGMPLAIKDIFSTKGVKTTCGSKILKDYIPPYDATVIKRLKDVQFAMSGKTNMDEFAMGSSNENSAYGACRNPWNKNTVSGGSSGGSVTAVAAGEAIAALGTDTGGSVRLPAAFTLLTGLKPTYGRISRYGMIAFASSLDQCSPIARTVEDCALLYHVLAGADEYDSTTSSMPVEPLPEFSKGFLKGKTLGIVDEFERIELPPEVSFVYEENKRALTDLGAKFKSVSIEDLDSALATYYIIAPSEASSNLGRYDSVRFGMRVENKNFANQLSETREAGFGTEVKRRIMLGTFALSTGYYEAYFLKALKVRQKLRQAFEKAFSEVDLIISPTSPTTAFPIGERTGDPLRMYMTDVLTLPVNLASLPAISVPSGLSADAGHGALPLGLQFIAPHWQENNLLLAAYDFEQYTKYYKLRPALEGLDD